ncbi:MAG: hypothetical protein Q4E12_06325 [Coriobacteriia bacterium]|nr:hypothetical protein [Coriobacteriia bacterium]
MLFNWFHKKYKDTTVPPQSEQKPLDKPVMARCVAPGVYELSERAYASVSILPDAVPPAGTNNQAQAPHRSSQALANQSADGYPVYGCLRGALKAPNQHDCYVVAFMDANHFRVLGYIDRYGRVFQTSGEVHVPPAEYPAVAFARYLTRIGNDVETGAVELYSKAGQITYPANYKCENDRYTLYGSWFDFSVTGQDLSLDDALARAYLAFVFRPMLYNLSVPHRDLAVVDQMLENAKRPLKALMRVVNTMESAEADPAQTPPALGRSLAYWLREAGITECQPLIDAYQDGALSLSLNTRFAHLYNLVNEANCDIPQRTLWKIEGALNRFRLVGDLANDQKTVLSLEQCNALQFGLFDHLADQAPDVSRPRDTNWDHPTTEWDVRSGIARGMESLRLPLRFEVEFRCNLELGQVFFQFMVPDASMMPAVRWQKAAPDASGQGSLLPGVLPTSGWVLQSAEQREGMAYDYAVRLGLLLAAVALRQSCHIHNVTLRAIYFREEEDQAPAKVAYLTCLSRETFADKEAWQAIARLDPRLLVNNMAASAAPAGWFGDMTLDFQQLQLSPEKLLGNVLESIREADVAHAQPVLFSKPSVIALGAQDATGLEINYNTGQTMIAESVAEYLAQVPSEPESFKVLREVQRRSDDPQVFEACNRVMGQIAEGQLDLTDQNQVMRAFMGPDTFVDAADAAARMRLNAFVQGGGPAMAGNPDLARANQQAMDSLRRTVEEAQAAGVFQDNEQTVYRVFDSTASRVVYNAVRNGSLTVPGLDLSADRGKKVHLASDGYYYCCLELLKLMEQSFGHHDDALRYGKLCLRMAPTMAAGYRQMARAYMLSGDLNSARETLLCALRFVTAPDDVALMYYQLAYVEWKAGHARVAVACYLKAIVDSVELRDQATNELRALISEEHQPVMEVSAIPSVFQDAGIPLAPNEEILALLRRASRAAVNEGLVPAAKNMLSVQLHYNHDDILAHVLRSLG